MSSTPIDQYSSLRIGTIEYVAPDELRVVLDNESPESIALNTGSPRLFPRINGYLLVPIDLGFMVGQISWITIERIPFIGKESNLVNLPMPLRKLQLHPIGELSKESNDEFIFSRGLESFPSVGDIVLIPTEEQLKSIIENGENRRVYIGTSPLIGNAQVKIDPDKLFGRHLAVLGNTGSGKSCSVAGLVRWSVEAARKLSPDRKANGRFIILDPNGEYSKAFEDMDSAKSFQVQVDGNDVRNRLKVPLWLWNSEEWCGFTKASEKTQRPTIVHALKSVKNDDSPIEVQSKINSLVKYVSIIITELNSLYNSGEPFGKFPKPKNFHNLIVKWMSGISRDSSFPKDLNDAIDEYENLMKGFITQRGGQYPNFSYTKNEVSDLYQKLKFIYQLGGGKEEDLIPIDANTPIPFNGKDFIRAIEASADLLKTSDYVDTLLTRVKLLIADSIIKSVVDDIDMTLEEWLEKYIGKNKEETITIIDLSLLPSEVTSIITAVIARMVFEALQRYRKMNKVALPTVLVMEEAHNFVKHYSDDDSVSANKICCKVFEKIAREGRKFGLGLVLSSQRPSELSPTVLSQCNTFLLHRISNERDQELVGKLLPDNMRSIFRELPALPSREAILLGWATDLPVLVKMRNLPKPQRPQSSDPDYWDVWTKETTREIDWKEIAEAWQKRNREANGVKMKDNADSK